MAATKACRFCGADLQRTFVDLGMSPLCETYPAAADLNRGESLLSPPCYVCEECWLVQLEEYRERREHFHAIIAYFSSFSDSWLKHCENYCEAKMTRRSAWTRQLRGGGGQQRWLSAAVFCPARCAGARHRASCQRCQGCGRKGRSHAWCASSERKLAKELAAEGRCADLVLGNNVLAQVPDLNDFVEGLKDAAEAGRGSDARISPSAEADPAQRIRHDLPRALFLLLVAHHHARSWRRMG